MAEIDPEVGRRVERLRKRAGLSRERLSAMADMSPTLIKFVETGRRSLTLRAAQRLAPHLGVEDLADLFGPSIGRFSLDARPAHPQVPEVRKALTTWRIQVDGAPQSPQYIRGAVDQAWQSWHASRQQRSEVGQVLPGLIDAAQRSVRLLAGDDRRQALQMLAETYHLAQAFMAWHGDRELIWMTVDRGMASAIESDDPLTIAGSTWYAAHLLRAVGRSDDAITGIRAAQAMIEPLVSDGPPEYASMLADLWACSALTRARVGDQGAWNDWDTARRVVAQALPPDYANPWTRMGRVLVDVYGVMCAIELGDSDDARRRAENLDPQTIPSVERRARHMVELARGTDLDGSREATLHLLARAVDISPETVQFSPLAREMVDRLASTGPAVIRDDAQRLAVRLGIR